MNKLNEILHSATRRMGGEKKAKRIAILSIVAVILVTLVSATFIINTSDDSVAENIGDLSYILNADKTATVNGLSDAGAAKTEIEIPSKIKNETYTVTAISYAFMNRTGLTSVTIPNSVTSIGDYAFAGCTALTSITIPNSVTTIGIFAFYECKGLTSVTIPDKVTTISKAAFAECSGLTSVTIPDSVITIGDGAFNKCKGLTSVTIPDKVTTISDSTFDSCTGLTSVTIPNGVTSIGDNAFYFCSNLGSITIPDSVITIGNNAFSSSGLKSIIIPDKVTTIGNNAFNDCAVLESVTIGTSVTSLGDYAFYDCKDLKSITIPNSVTTIGRMAFYSCSTLVNVIITGTGTAPKDGSDVISKYFKNTNWGLPGITDKSQIKTLTLGFKSDYAYDLNDITTITTGKIIFDADAKATAGGPFVTSKSGYDIIGADRAGLTFECTTDKWKAPENVYGVHFNGNGSTEGKMDDQTFAGEKALNSNTFKKAGYAFAGWNTKADGSGDKYTDGQPVTPTSDILLYAQWAEEYTITFTQPAHGSLVVTDDAGKVIISGSPVLQGTKLTFTYTANEGYRFVSWNGIAGTNPVTVTVGSDLTVSVNEEIIPYTVKFNPNNGSGSMSDQTFEHGVAKNLSKNVFTRGGYTFAGWNTKADGSGDKYTDEQSITLKSDMDLYAQWTPNTYTVKFDPNNGSGTMGDQTFTFGAAQNLSKNLFTRDGYTFAGWSVTQGSSVVTYSDEALYTIGIGNATLYAVWTLNDYKVTFDPNSGTGTMGDQTFTPGVAKNLSKNLFIKDGYRFAGWSVTQGSSVVTYSDEALYTIGIGNATLYAQWTMERTLSFDANGGTVTPVSKKVAPGSAIGDLPTPTKDGYKFVKWQIDGIDITSKTIWTYNDNKTAKAVFEPLPTPDPVNPSPPFNMDVSNVLYIGFAVLLTILLASLVAVLLRSKN